MKSDKAKEYIDSHAKRIEECIHEASTDIGKTVLPVVQVIHAVEMAEYEVENRMRNKVYKIVNEMMACIFQGDMPRKIANEFIQKLTEDEND